MLTLQTTANPNLNITQPYLNVTLTLTLHRFRLAPLKINTSPNKIRRKQNVQTLHLAILFWPPALSSVSNHPWRALANHSEWWNSHNESTSPSASYSFTETPWRGRVNLCRRNKFNTNRKLFHQNKRETRKIVKSDLQWKSKCRRKWLSNRTSFWFTWTAPPWKMLRL